MQSIYGRRAKRKTSLFRFWLIAGAFMLIVVNNGNAQLFTPSVNDLVNRKGFTWRSEDTAHFRFYFESGTFGEKHIDKLTKGAEQARNRVLPLLGDREYKEQITVFVLDSRARMKALIGHEINGLALPNRNAVLYVFSDTIDASGSHEFCHVFAENLWGEADDWINEGLAVYSDDNWDQYQLHDLAKHLLLKNKLIPLQEVVKHFNKYSERTTYPECGSLVKFLYEKYGASKVREIWKKGISAIPQITGKKLDELEKEWLDVIEQADASHIKYFAPRVGKRY